MKADFLWEVLNSNVWSFRQPEESRQTKDRKRISRSREAVPAPRGGDEA